MDLIEHYNELHETSVRKINIDEYLIDPFIDSPDDKRFGLTLLIRPPENINNKIQMFLEELKRIDPTQYYYPSSDIHITVMSVISCYHGFRLEGIAISEYRDVVKKSLQGIEKFNIEFRGVTAADSGILIQGFPGNGTLNNLRENLRENFKNSGVEHSIDKRYTLRTAHSTVMRFRKKIQKRKEFLKVIEENRNRDFGGFQINDLELVFNDWYQRKNNSILLGKFAL